MPAKPLSAVEAMVANTETCLLDAGAISSNDVIGIVAGTQSTTGSTNFIRLHRAGKQVG
jgi:pyruvate kinase